MRLAKAMVKSLETIAPYLRCCEAQIRFIEERRAEGSVIIDLDSIKPLLPGLTCIYCKADASFGNEVYVVKSLQPGLCSGWTHLDHFDIDEAPYIEN